MDANEIKPLNWTPAPGIGYTVVRRSDGGLHFTFTDISEATLAHWRDFSMQHLYDSDRLTRNLYDLRQIKQLNETAVRYAVEVNSDPLTRNIRLAVVVSSEEMRSAIQRIGDMTTPSEVELGIFTDIDESETWLSRPLILRV